MKIFFTASFRGKTRFSYMYDMINDVIKNLGYQSIDDTLIRMDMDEFNNRTKKNDINYFIDRFDGAISKLKEADINIFECSEQSFTIGYMVQKSLEMNKPTIVLYQEGFEPSYFIFGSQEEKLMAVKYDKENIESILKKSIEASSKLADKRFNFFISPSLLTFINHAARQQGISKSTLIRNLINEHLRKNSNK